MEQYGVRVEFPHVLLTCYNDALRLHMENEQQAIEDGLPPKRLYSDIDHTGESPGTVPVGVKC